MSLFSWRFNLGYADALAGRHGTHRFQAGLRDRPRVLRTFPKLQQNSCKYYRSIDLFRNKILSVALLGGRPSGEKAAQRWKCQHQRNCRLAYWVNSLKVPRRNQPVNFQHSHLRNEPVNHLHYQMHN